MSLISSFSSWLLWCVCLYFEICIIFFTFWQDFSKPGGCPLLHSILINDESSLSSCLFVPKLRRVSPKKREKGTPWFFHHYYWFADVLRLLKSSFKDWGNWGHDRKPSGHHSKEHMRDVKEIKGVFFISDAKNMMLHHFEEFCINDGKSKKRKVADANHHQFEEHFLKKICKRRRVIQHNKYSKTKYTRKSFPFEIITSVLSCLSHYYYHSLWEEKCVCVMVIQEILLM